MRLLQVMGELALWLVVALGAALLAVCVIGLGLALAVLL